ncbi:glycosyltransferase family 4 protein [Rubrivivax albus]|uniref:glycosyltransferase family 4 protein n=1 Tax=Rubrivivax albus TaxID=2499835 RepID=UPI0018EEA990|nr:glycosyltransferase family 4 protein [Rubrivivax albus]
MTGVAGLRIGIVGPLPPPAGGMAMQTRQLAELLGAAQARVELVPTNPSYRPAWVARLRGVRALFRLLPYLAALWRAAGRVDVLHVMANSGWSWHLFAAPAIWVARVRRTPVVVNYRGGEAGPFLAKSAAVVRASLRHVARLVVPSGFLQDVFARHGIRSEIVPNIVDLQRFRPGARVGEAQIIVARNLEPIYDNATAIRAFAQVHARHAGARLVLAGTGPEEGELRALAASMGLQAVVEFAGRLDRDTMAARLRASRIALNPSRVDNMPNSVLEAMASGVAVVSTRVGGVPYIVEHGRTALLVPPADPDAMAQALLALLEDEGLHERLRTQALTEVQAYTWEAVGPQWAAVYREVAHMAPQAAG